MIGNSPLRLSRSIFRVAMVVSLWAGVSFLHLQAGEPEGAVDAETETAAERGFRLLRTKPYLPADFDQEVFENLWKVWPEPLRSQAENATPDERREMAFSRYGLMKAADGDGTGPGLGYAPDGKGGWAMNCLACHAGKVAGRTIPGLPNSHFGMQTLTEEVRFTKIAMGKKLSHLDLGSMTIPLGTTHGTTNSVIFGVVLGALRDRDLNFNKRLPVPELTHHDMDAPPFWNVKHKTKLYCDGFSPKNHRVLVQFVMETSNSGERIRGWEEDFRAIEAWIESVEAPKYPWPIDEALAGKGRPLFETHCSDCHGTYGKGGRYEQKIVPIDVVGTDRVRLDALTPEARAKIRDSWMSFYGDDDVITDPGGYVAPPLHGIWASAPYLHNGSVPTLWHLFHPDERPAVWSRTEDGYDREKLGLEVETFDAVPGDAKSAAARRMYFDTRKPGKSAAGHRFPEVLTPEEKRAVLEYLKML